MDAIQIVITAAAALTGSGGIVALYQAKQNSARFKAQSETEARAGFTAEFEALVAALTQQLKDVKDEMKQVKQEAAEVKKEGKETQEEVKRLRQMHLDSEAYIDTLITGISNQTIPPIPPRN